MIRARWFWHSMAVVAVILLLPQAAYARQGTHEVAAPFRAYYAQHQGIRLLGYPLTDLQDVDGFPAQYFEKGRIEDHRSAVADPTWRFMFGRLTDELMQRNAEGAVSGTSITYGTLAEAHRPSGRAPIPAGFAGGTMAVPGGRFVPYDPYLWPEPGYIVPSYFWSYMNRTDLFPGGWLHDIGLPMTGVFQATAIKNGVRRSITIQAFERTVLTFDARNPASWQVERGNIGADALGTLPQPEDAIEIPAAGARVTLPLRILARVGSPGGQVVARLRWQDGTELLRVFPILRGEDGQGLLIGSLGWMTEGPPPQPPTQPATLEILSASGELQARQTVTALSADDPGTQLVSVYWVLGEDVVPARQRIPRTVQIGTAALNELLWGPAPGNLAGFETAIPTPEQVLSFPGREPGWGPRVTLRSLVIRDGVATADFSRELKAYGGGSLRVMLIRKQITQTLLQFPTVRTVRIAIEGQTEAVLEP
jgi:hypothetical protein